MRPSQPISLIIPSEARTRGQRKFPAPHLITAIGWFLVGLSLLALVLWSRQAGSAPPVVWLVASVASITGSFGIPYRARWARILVSLVAVSGGLFVGLLSLSAFYPLEWFWWPGAVFVGFCAWTLFFTLALWNDYVPAKTAAA